MLARSLAVDAAKLGDPDDAAWSAAELETVALAPTPLGLQPSRYLAAAGERPVGRVTQVKVRALHNGRELAFHLEWEDAEGDTAPADNDVFPDGAALLFPLRGDAPLMTMGSPEKPVAAWHWRADHPEHARTQVAEGLGTTRVVDESAVATAASRQGGRWRLVFRRPLHVPDASGGALQIGVGDTLQVAFAVWEGANGERGGLKSFSPSWHAVTLEG